MPTDASQALRNVSRILVSGDETDLSRIDAFITKSDAASMLLDWFGADFLHENSPDVILTWLERDLAKLDDLLSNQLNEVINNPAFSRLESTWSGVAYLCKSLERSERVLVRILNASWTDIAKDFERSLGFDASALFDKVYREEFGMPGGKPFGILLIDHYARNARTKDYAIDDIAVIDGLSSVAAGAFAPTFVGVSPHVFELESFAGLARLRRIPEMFSQINYSRYHQLRRQEDTVFIGLVMPRVKVRRQNLRRSAALDFVYRLHPSDETNIWINGVYAVGEVVIRAFYRHGWFTEICGSQRNSLDFGVVSKIMPADEGNDISYESPHVECVIAPEVENELALGGITCISKCKDTPYLVFNTMVSLRVPAQFTKEAATENSQISVLMRYILSVSRFAHYLKVIMRDKVGSYQTADAIEQLLYNWILGYTNGDDDADDNTRARYPLRAAKVEVREMRGAPGRYNCIFHLQPHFHIDRVYTNFRLVTELRGRFGQEVTA